MRRLSLGVLLIGLLLTARPALSQGSGDLELNLFFGGSWHSNTRYKEGRPFVGCCQEENLPTTTHST